MKNYSKVKPADAKAMAGRQAQKLGYRTPEHFKGQTFAVPASRLGGPKLTRATAPRFNPAQFRTQHKG